MNKRLIECVPNFSEGNNLPIIKQITDQIESVSGIRLLDVDPGKATNRTVVTFVGTPEDVIEAAFLGIRKACEVIDMRHHKGEHPRFGATDVCPFVPVSGVTMEETAEYARILARRVGEELQIPVYCYEFAAFEEKRKNLANIRSGEYEGLPEKLKDPEWEPDFGPSEFVSRTGSIAIGARNFLVAYNVNLNTTSIRRANSIAFDIREAGRILRQGDQVTGPVIKDENGEPVRVPGSLKKVKAIGWYIEEYGMAQISINLTDISITPIHVAFEEVCNKAIERGIRVTGSELVGLVPLDAMLQAGRYFLKKQQRSTGIPEKEIINIAVKSLGLDDLKPFIPKEKIIEYILADQDNHPLINMDLASFADETASESPTPGGGSISAYMGAMGAALGTMVANLSSHKRGWDNRWEEFSDWADKGMYYVKELNRMVDEDTHSFNLVMDAFALPKNNDEEKKIRKEAIQAATRYATEVPFRVMQLALESMDVLESMAKIGNPNSVSDAGVGALAARSAVLGAFLNVKINARDLNDRVFAEDILVQAKEIETLAIDKEIRILEIVKAKI
ncbi:MAG: glutamate formimidoyltransferase [Porphyromonadaceae bacterium]|nr:MAG: glutamate formimidoyltransferase [Porphyromonadaceae bacterium]